MLKHLFVFGIAAACIIVAGHAGTVKRSIFGLARFGVRFYARWHSCKGVIFREISCTICIYRYYDIYILSRKAVVSRSAERAFSTVKEWRWTKLANGPLWPLNVLHCQRGSQTTPKDPLDCQRASSRHQNKGLNHGSKSPFIPQKCPSCRFRRAPQRHEGHEGQGTCPCALPLCSPLKI